MRCASSRSPVLAARPSARWLGCFALLSLALLVGACGGSQPPSESTSAPASDAPPGTMAASQEVREISESELTRYFAVIKELRALGSATDAKLGDDPSEMQGMFVGMEATGKFGEILARNGFTHSSFTAVHYNVIQAYGAIQIDERQSEIEASKSKQAAALEQMKGKVSAEQLEMMKQATGQANQMLDAYRDVPPKNKELMRRHRAEFEAVMRS